MKRRPLASLIASSLLACSISANAQSGATKHGMIILVGDSTMATLNGYGDVVCSKVAPGVECLNLAKNGRSSKSFRAEGLWDDVLAHLRNITPGLPAYVLIQFGHNDQPGKTGRSTDLQTEFPNNMTRYVTELRQAGATPVLVTPLTRRTFKGDTLEPDLEPWAQATRAVAQAQGVLLVDLYAQSYAAVQSMGQAQADTLAMDAHLAPGLAGIERAVATAPAPARALAKSKFDRTHLGYKGADYFGGMMVRALVSVEGLSRLVKAD